MRRKFCKPLWKLSFSIEEEKMINQCENYIKEAKYDMAVGHLLLKSFWSNEAIFQMKKTIDASERSIHRDHLFEGKWRKINETWNPGYIHLEPYRAYHRLLHYRLIFTLRRGHRS